LLFSFSFLVLIASEETNQGEILSKSVVLVFFFVLVLVVLIRFWLLTPLDLLLLIPLGVVVDVGNGNLDNLLLLAMLDKDLVTGWLEAKDVS
jgi:hypothetical protein